MNCSACGTQLPDGAANCPQCGAATPYFYSQASVAPDNPTVVSSPYADARQPPPPTMYGSPSYETEAQSSYGSSSFHNPYESYKSYEVAPSAPPPPSPKSPGNRIGILVGVVILVLLLIGVVCLRCLSIHRLAMPRLPMHVPLLLPVLQYSILRRREPLR